MSGPLLDHVSVRVTDYEKSKAFYGKVLDPIKAKLLMEPAPLVCGFGHGDIPTFWISQCPNNDDAGRVTPAHVAFSAESQALVDMVHAAALKAGAKNDGDPGPRQYHPTYYAGYFLDPDGHKLEVVCHTGRQL